MRWYLKLIIFFAHFPQGPDSYDVIDIVFRTVAVLLAESDEK